MINISTKRFPFHVITNVDLVPVLVEVIFVFRKITIYKIAVLLSLNQFNFIVLSSFKCVPPFLMVNSCFNYY